MAKGHSAKERKLLDDIRVKNAIRGRMEDRVRKVEDWKQDLESEKKRARRKRLEQSIARFEKEIESLRKDVLQRDEHLVKRIQGELQVSEKEIEEFRNRYKKEAEELIKAREDLKKARKTTSEEVLRKIALAERQVKREGEDVEKAQQEIKSEERDKILLDRELKRATAELAHYAE